MLFTQNKKGKQKSVRPNKADFERIHFNFHCELRINQRLQSEKAAWQCDGYTAGTRVSCYASHEKCS